MSYTTVAELRSALGIGTLYSDAVLQSVADAADNVLIPFLWKNEQPIIAHSSSGTVGTLYFDTDIREVFYVGQTVTISNSGSSYNGSKVITAVGDYSISMTTNHTTAQPKHAIAPYGSVASRTYTDWTTDMAVQQAALMISVEIWQARTATHI